MHQYIKALLCGLVTLAIFGGHHAQGGYLDTVNWTPDSVADGLGTGTLANGSILVSYLSIAGGNSGATVIGDFTTSLATAGATSMGISNDTAGVLASSANSSPVTEKIVFSSTVVNPVLLVNDGDAGDNFFFSASERPYLLSYNNIEVNNSTNLEYYGPNGDIDSGFAAQFYGTFGPGTPLTFTADTIDSFSQYDFTVGIAPVSVPEPSTLTLCGVGSAFGSMCIFYKRKQKLRTQKPGAEIGR